MTYDKRNSDNEKKPTVSFLRDGIETRILSVANLYESRKHAADAAGSGVSSLQRWITGDGMPAFDSIAQLALKQGVSLEWLATGQGSMFAEGEADEGELDSKYAFIPLYDATCSAGSGAWNDRERVLTHIAFTRYSLRKQGLEVSQLSAVRIKGDSMEPLLHDNDTVLIDHNQSSITADGIYVLRVEDHLYAKRLQRQMDGSLLVISENNVYKPMTVGKEALNDLAIIGRVVWSAGWM